MVNTVLDAVAPSHAREHLRAQLSSDLTGAMGACLDDQTTTGLQATLEALEATGRGVATALVQAFADAGMKVEIETELEKGPAFEIGEPLGEEHTAAIVAAMSA